MRGLAGLVVLLLALAGPAWADPPIWRVRDADTEMVLYGSVHALPDGVEWQSPEFNAALHAADLVVFETLTPASREEVDEAMRAAFVEYRPLIESMLAERPLHEVIGPEAFARVRRMQEASGLPADLVEVAIEAIDETRPWAAAQSLYQNSGPYGRPGVGLARELEWSLGTASRTEALTEVGTDFMVTLAFSRIAEAEGKSLLIEILDWLESDRRPAQERETAWVAGDAGSILERVLAMQAVAPRLYKAAVVEPNQAWLPALERMMTAERRVVVIVDAAHLVGADGLPALLRQAGYAVEGP